MRPQPLTRPAVAMRRHARRHARRALYAVRQPVAARAYLDATPDPLLHIGCGGALLDGWLNTDRDPPAGAVYLDVTRPFPLPSDRFAAALSEHVIEHVSFDAGRRMLRECARVLRPGGRIRVSTPDLDRLVALTDEPADEAARRYLSWAREMAADGAMSARALALNTAFRGWGHLYLYDEATLARALRDAGFQDLRRCEYRESPDPVFAGVEGRGIDAVGLRTRAFETLALEARRSVVR